MSKPNDIIDQIENKINFLLSYINANQSHFSKESIADLKDGLKIDFANFKAAEYDTREDWEIEEDAKESRMCDEFHASRDNKLTR